MAEASYRLGNVDTASQLADKSLRENPDLVRAKLVKGALLADQGERKNLQSFIKRPLRPAAKARSPQENLLKH